MVSVEEVNRPPGPVAGAHPPPGVQRALSPARAAGLAAAGWGPQRRLGCFSRLTRTSGWRMSRRGHCCPVSSQMSHECRSFGVMWFTSRRNELVNACELGGGGIGWDASEGKGPQRSQRRLDRRLEEVAKAVGGGYCRLQWHLASGGQWLGIGWAP